MPPLLLCHWAEAHYGSVVVDEDALKNNGKIKTSEICRNCRRPILLEAVQAHAEKCKNFKRCAHEGCGVLIEVSEQQVNELEKWKGGKNQLNVASLAAARSCVLSSPLGTLLCTTQRAL
jgi:hypothetical protein